MILDINNFPKDKQPLVKAILKVGSIRKFASNLHISHQAVHAWIYREGYQVAPPAKHCQAIEDMTFGYVTKRELRPDIFDERDKTKLTKSEQIENAMIVIEEAIRELRKSSNKTKKRG